MRVVTINIQQFLLNKIEDYMFNEKCSSRSEFLRKAIDDYLAEYDWDFVDSKNFVITVNLEIPVIEKMNTLIENGVACSRSEFVRAAVLNKIRKIEKRIEEERKKMEEKEKLKPTTKNENGVEIIMIPQTPEYYKAYKIIPKEERK